MVRMSTIWDRTVEVLRGRASMLAGIAFLLLFLPTVVQNAVTSFFASTSPTYFAVVGLVALGVGLLSIWGNLSIVAAASDPGTNRGAALAIGAARLPTAIGLTFLMLLAVLLLLLPTVALIAGSGVPIAALMSGAKPADLDMSGVSPGAIVGSLLYVIFVLLPAVIWLSARLALFSPVIVNERLGVQTFARSWRLTRGLTWRIVGVFLLFGAVYLITAGAAQLVVAIVFRLLLGAEQTATATFLAAVFAAAAGAVFGVITGTFTAQLYRALTGQEAAQTFA